MATLKQAVQKNKTTQTKKRRNLKAIARASASIRLGEDPVVTRNTKLEETWGILMGDPSVAHSDPNRWRASADVRPSSFPFCGRKYVMHRLGLKLEDPFTVESNFYTEIGKAVHYVAQNAFARTGRLWGYWLCARPSCEKRIQRQYHNEAPDFFPRKEKCSCGSEYFEYEELVVSDPNIGLRGHCDGVLVFKNFSSVLEIKTTSSEKIQQIRTLSDEQVQDLVMTTSPWYGYWHQASTYAALLRMKYPDLPWITRVDFLLYSRDKPKDIAAFSVKVPDDNSWWVDIRSRIVQAQEARDRKILPVGFARTPDEIDALPTCTWCAYKRVCLRPQGKLTYEADALYDEQANSDLVQIAEREKETWAKLYAETL